MKKLLDLSIFKKFNFEYQPVGVKFSLFKPVGIRQLNKQLSFCEMLKEAQNSEPFYAAKENHDCKNGPYLLGMTDGDAIMESGQIGPKLGVFEDARANRRLYQQLAKLPKNIVNYVAFSSLEYLTFDPDLLIITAKPNQAEIIHRAVGYRTGATWNAIGSTVVGCSWMYIQPYISGKLNMMVSGLQHGMKARQLFPEGLLFLSIPFDLLPGIVDCLEVMEWELPQYSYGMDTHKIRMKAINDELIAEMQK